jgi:tryptophan synthase alpha chain
MTPPSEGPPETPAGSPIAEAFRARNRRGQAALVPFVCAGFPDEHATLRLLRSAADAGADVIELGVPFSDPLADGPTIQRASFHALQGGTTLRSTLELLREFRRESTVPVVIFTYLNPVYRYGLRPFVADAREAGAQGLLLTDLPAGADPEAEEAVREGGLDLIRLVAPTTEPGRLARIVDGAGGFVYYISRTGVTGARSELPPGLPREIEAVRSAVPLPLAVGFGISSPEQAALVAGLADGVVVGSALVEAVERGGVEEGGSFLRALRAAMDERGKGAGSGASG